MKAKLYFFHYLFLWLLEQIASWLYKMEFQFDYCLILIYYVIILYVVISF